MESKKKTARRWERKDRMKDREEKEDGRKEINEKKYRTQDNKEGKKGMGK